MCVNYNAVAKVIRFFLFANLLVRFIPNILRLPKVFGSS
jgi:hypothetical protein